MGIIISTLWTLKFEKHQALLPDNIITHPWGILSLLLLSEWETQRKKKHPQQGGMPHPSFPSQPES